MMKQLLHANRIFNTQAFTFMKDKFHHSVTVFIFVNIKYVIYCFILCCISQLLC